VGKVKQGRPMKYRHFLLLLKDDQLYSAASITRYGQSLGLFGPGLKKEALALAKQRVRVAMGRLAQSHAFPTYGDGQVKLPGQAATPAWLGKRWKAVLK